MATSMFIQGLSLVLFPYVSEMWQVYTYAVVMAVSGRAMTVVFFAYWAQAYGPKHLSRYRRAAQMLTMIHVRRWSAGAAAWGNGPSIPTLQSSSRLSIVSFLFALAAALVPMPKQLPPSKVTP